MPNGNYQVGVHIADVTHFVKPNTAIDDEAAARSTTVYLCDRRIDMLPPLLGTSNTLLTNQDGAGGLNLQIYSIRSLLIDAPRGAPRLFRYMGKLVSTGLVGWSDPCRYTRRK